MIDKSLLFLDAAAYNATPAVIDLGTTFNPGENFPLEGFISCPAGDCAGVTALVIKTGSTTSPTTDVATIVMTAAQINTGNRRFTMPSAGMLRYCTISLTGASAGTTLTCGLVLDNQSA
jgi:hypothetical protein